MKYILRKIVLLLALSSLLLITGCTGSGGGYTSVNYGVYGGYGYPAGYGYGGCCYDNDIDVDINRNHLDREQRVETRQNVSERSPSHSGSFSGMGRPSGGMSRGGGGRRR